MLIKKLETPFDPHSPLQFFQSAILDDQTSCAPPPPLLQSRSLLSTLIISLENRIESRGGYANTIESVAPGDISPCNTTWLHSDRIKDSVPTRRRGLPFATPPPSTLSACLESGFPRVGKFIQPEIKTGGSSLLLFLHLSRFSRFVIAFALLSSDDKVRIKCGQQWTEIPSDWYCSNYITNSKFENWWMN